MAEKNLKVYYTIKDVAEIVGVTEPTLRFWETEFPHIKPKTTANKVRQYTMKEIDDIDCSCQEDAPHQSLWCG